MASSAAKHVVSLFFLLTIFSSLHTPTHARDSQFFNKLPSSTTSDNNIVPDKEQPLNNQQEDQEPSFQPENENGYGLDGQESSSQLPSSATTTTTTTTIPLNAESKQPLNKYLPKNYNPVAYVTEPEDTSDTSTSFTEEKSYPNKNNYYYNSQQEEEYKYYPTTTTNNRNNNYYNGGGSSFNTHPQGMSDTRFMDSATTNSREKYFNNGGEINSYQPQGMSDTRFFENGKYFYDVNSEKYSSNHPYTSLRGVRTRNHVYNNRNYYGNNENAYEFNDEDSINGGYQNQDEFQDEEDNNMP